MAWEQKDDVFSFDESQLKLGIAYGLSKVQRLLKDAEILAWNNGEAQHTVSLYSIAVRVWQVTVLGRIPSIIQ